MDCSIALKAYGLEKAAIIHKMLNYRFYLLNLFLNFFQPQFLKICVHLLLLHTNPYKAKYTHVNIGNPHKSKTSNKVSSPIGKQQVVSCDNQKEKGNIMAKTIFAGKEIKEFSLQDSFTGFRFFHAKISWFSKYFFMRYCPGNTGNG